jgi:hypothetical protein
VDAQASEFHVAKTMAPAVGSDEGRKGKTVTNPLDVTTPQKDSPHPGALGAPGQFNRKAKTPRPRLTPAELDAREFIDAVLVYPVGCEFNLYNLQGDIGIRLSCLRRGKVPAELEFAHEIALAKEFGWLCELEEDVEFTKSEQEAYERPGIRYGAKFVRTASNAAIKAQREQFIGKFLATASAEATRTLARDSKAGPYVGKWFHSHHEDGALNWQGQITGQSKKRVRVQLYEWLMGNPSSRTSVPISEIKDWTLYNTDAEMREAGDAYLATRR